MMFYNIDENLGQRYLYNGIILYNYLKENVDNKLEYKEIKDYELDNVSLLPKDYIYYYRLYNIKYKVSAHIIGRDRNLDILQSKTEQYRYFKKYMIEGKYVDRKEFIQNMKYYIDNRYMIQFPNSGGGDGNFIIDEYNILYKILPMFDKEKLGKVMKFINTNRKPFGQFILFKDGYYTLYYANEIISNNFNCIGAEYPYIFNSKEEETKIRSISDEICNFLITHNCIGIITIDYFIDNSDNIYLTEVNCKKGSVPALSGLITQYIWNKSLPILEYECCKGLSINEIDFNKVKDINWYFYKIIYKEEYEDKIILQNKDILNYCDCNDIIDIYFKDNKQIHRLVFNK